MYSFINQTQENYYNHKFYHGKAFSICYLSMLHSALCRKNSSWNKSGSHPWIKTPFAWWSDMFHSSFFPKLQVGLNSYNDLNFMFSSRGWEISMFLVFLFSFLTAALNRIFQSWDFRRSRVLMRLDSWGWPFESLFSYFFECVMSYIVGFLGVESESMTHPHRTCGLTPIPSPFIKITTGGEEQNPSTKYFSCLCG